MGATGGLKNIKKVSTCSVLALNLEKEPSYYIMRQILANKNEIAFYMDPHGHKRRKKW